MLPWLSPLLTLTWQRVEEHRAEETLSFKNLLCIKKTGVGVATGVELCSAVRGHLVDDKIQTGLWGNVNRTLTFVGNRLRCFTEVRRSSVPCFEALEHHAQEHGMFRNILAEKCQMVQQIRRSPSSWVGAADGRWGSFAAIFTHSSFDRQETRGVVCMYICVIKCTLAGWVCGFFSLQWTPLVIIYVWFRAGTTLVGDLPLQKSAGVWKASAVRGAAVSNTSTCRCIGLWYGGFLWSEVSVMCAPIRMGHTGHWKAWVYTVKADLSLTGLLQAGCAGFWSAGCVSILTRFASSAK